MASFNDNYYRRSRSSSLLMVQEQDNNDDDMMFEFAGFWIENEDPLELIDAVNKNSMMMSMTRAMPPTPPPAPAPAATSTFLLDKGPEHYMRDLMEDDNLSVVSAPEEGYSHEMIPEPQTPPPRKIMRTSQELKAIHKSNLRNTCLDIDSFVDHLVFMEEKYSSSAVVVYMEE